MNTKDPPPNAELGLTSQPETRDTFFLSTSTYSLSLQMGKMLSMNARQVESILERYQFTLVSQEGSHRKWRNVQTKRQVIVPYHGGHILPTGTLRSIFKAAEIPESEWRT